MKRDYVYESRLELAEKFLLQALKNNDLYFYLAGLPPYDIKFPNDQTGQLEVKMFYFLDALYCLHKKRPDLEIDKKVYTMLCNCLNKTITNDIRKTLLGDISYMLDCDLSHRATFSIDYKSLLELAKNKIDSDKIYLDNEGIEYKEKVGSFEPIDQSVDSITKKVSLL